LLLLSPPEVPADDEADDDAIVLVADMDGVMADFLDEDDDDVIVCAVATPDGETCSVT